MTTPHRRRRFAFASLFAFAFASALTAQSTWHVDAAAPPGGDGSAGAPFQNLGAAFAVAASGDTVTVAAGAYQGPNNRDLDTLGRNLTLTGAGSATTTLNCGGSAADPHRALRISGFGSVVSVQGFRVVDAYVGGAIGAAGGGLFVDSGATAHVVDCTFDACQSDNQWPSRGAGVYVGPAAAADFTDCGFQGCLAAEGAGAFVESAATASFTNCTFASNASLTGGAAVWCADGVGSAAFTGCSFALNVGNDGGALRTGTPTVLQNCGFTGNHGTSGGAVLSSGPTATLSATDTTFSSNTAAGDGGALSVQFGAAAALAGCTLTGNQAAAGGGALAVAHSAGPRAIAFVTNCQFASNTAGGHGGAVLSGYAGDLHLSLCNIGMNTAQFGGGLAFLSLSDSTAVGVDVVGNAADHGGGVFAAADGTNAPNFVMTGGNLSQNLGTVNGGGAHGIGGGQLSFVGASISRNYALSGSGGGLRFESGCFGRVEGGVLFGNSAVIGGGMFCSGGAFADLVDCDVVFNSAMSRIAGVGADDMSSRFPTLSLERTTLRSNSAPYDCAVRVANGASAVARSCVVVGNVADDGPAFTALDAVLEIRHCTVVDNFGIVDGAALRTEFASAALIVNSILRGGYYPQIAAPAPATVVVVGCDVEGGAPGVGNFDADPLFANAAGGDFRPTLLSPCRNAGQNAFSSVADVDRDGAPRLMEGIADVGAYERLPAMPGSGEDVALSSYVTGSPIGSTGHSADPGDLLSLGLTSPAGTFLGALPVIVGTLYTAAAPPPFAGFLPYLHVDLGNFFFLVDGSAPPPFYVQALGSNGVWLSTFVPPGLAGFVLRVQGAAIAATAGNGAFAASDAHEVAFR